MFEHLQAQPADKILGLMVQFREDTRAEKIDLGVGVYRNAEGQTPVMRAVKAAEQQLVDTQETKAYTGLAGDPAFADAMIGLILGETVARDRIAAIATPGGTGAIRQALELIRLATPSARVWVSNPTWGNHVTILNYLKIPNCPYRYFEPATGTVDFDDMIADLNGAAPGDVVLLHGCCHNPTGANLTAEQWQAVIDTLLA